MHEVRNIDADSARCVIIGGYAVPRLVRVRRTFFVVYTQERARLQVAALAWLLEAEVPNESRYPRERRYKRGCSIVRKVNVLLYTSRPYAVIKPEGERQSRYADTSLGARAVAYSHGSVIAMYTGAMGLLFQCTLNFRLLAMPHFLMELVCIGTIQLSSCLQLNLGFSFLLCVASLAEAVYHTLCFA